MTYIFDIEEEKNKLREMIKWEFLFMIFLQATLIIIGFLLILNSLYYFAIITFLASLCVAVSTYSYENCKDKILYPLSMPEAPNNIDNDILTNCRNCGDPLYLNEITDGCGLCRRCELEYLREYKNQNEMNIEHNKLFGD